MIKKIIFLTFIIIGCSNRPVLVPNNASSLFEDNTTAISATVYSISSDSLETSIAFDIRSDFDKYLIDVLQII